AIDTSVLLDLLVDDPGYARVSEAALRSAAGEGALLISECVLAELAPSFASEAMLDEFLSDLQLEFVPSSRESAILAGSMLRSSHGARGCSRGNLPAALLRPTGARPPGASASAYAGGDTCRSPAESCWQARWQQVGPRSLAGPSGRPLLRPNPTRSSSIPTLTTTPPTGWRWSRKRARRMAPRSGRTIAARRPSRCRASTPSSRRRT